MVTGQLLLFWGKQSLTNRNDCLSLEACTYRVIFSFCTERFRRSDIEPQLDFNLSHGSNTTNNAKYTKALHSVLFEDRQPRIFVLFRDSEKPHDRTE
jgi:hypothetical protein